MSSLIDNYTDADGQPVQPYFAAYMIKQGFTRASQAKGHEFIIWIRARWVEFGRIHKIPETHLVMHRPEFHAWLSACVTDAACRNHVEGIAA